MEPTDVTEAPTSSTPPSPAATRRSGRLPAASARTAGPTLLEATSDVTGDAIEGPVAFAPFCLDSDCTANEQVHDSPAPHAAAPPVAVPPAGP